MCDIHLTSRGNIFGDSPLLTPPSYPLFPFTTLLSSMYSISVVLLSDALRQISPLPQWLPLNTTPRESLRSRFTLPMGVSLRRADRVLQRALLYTRAGRVSLLLPTNLHYYASLIEAYILT